MSVNSHFNSYGSVSQVLLQSRKACVEALRCSLLALNVTPSRSFVDRYSTAGVPVGLGCLTKLTSSRVAISRRDYFRISAWSPLNSIAMIISISPLEFENVSLVFPSQD